MPSSHTGNLAGRIEALDRFKVFVKHPAFKVDLDAAEVFSRQEK
jgi:hypothetical protein